MNVYKKNRSFPRIWRGQTPLALTAIGVISVTLDTSYPHPVLLLDGDWPGDLVAVSPMT